MILLSLVSKTIPAPNIPLPSNLPPQLVCLAPPLSKLLPTAWNRLVIICWQAWTRCVFTRVQFYNNLVVLRRSLPWHIVVHARVLLPRYHHINGTGFFWPPVFFIQRYHIRCVLQFNSVTYFSRFYRCFMYAIAKFCLKYFHELFAVFTLTKTVEMCHYGRASYTSEVTHKSQHVAT